MISVAVERTTIDLGSLNLEVFQVESGDYYLSITQILTAIGINEAWFRTIAKKAPRVLEWLQSNGFRGVACEGKILKEPKARRAKLISIPDATLIWVHFASSDNALAKGLLVACAVEALERRADKAFGKDRSEVERNQRFKSRQSGIKVRNSLTDAIQEWYKVNKGAKAEWEIYAIVTNIIYVAIWGLDAIGLEKHLDCPRNKSRDYMDADSLEYLKYCEHKVADLIEMDCIAPILAAKRVKLKSRPLPTRHDPLDI